MEAASPCGRQARARSRRRTRHLGDDAALATAGGGVATGWAGSGGMRPVSVACSNIGFTAVRSDSAQAMAEASLSKSSAGARTQIVPKVLADKRR